MKKFVISRWALLFLIAAILAAWLGLGPIAGTAAWMAETLFTLILYFCFLIFRRQGAGPKIT